MIDLNLLTVNYSINIGYLLKELFIYKYITLYL